MHLRQLFPYILSQKKAVIFDMDGTIVDNMTYHTKAWQTFAKSKGVEVDYEVLLRGLSGTATEYLSALMGIKDENELRDLEKEKEGVYRAMYKNFVKEIDGFRPFLYALKAHQKKIGLATLANTENEEFTLEALGINAYFDDIKNGDDVVHGKPHPEIYVKSLLALGVRAEDAIVFEDSKGGILAAKAAGIEVIGIETSNTASDLLEWGAMGTTPNYLFIEEV